ncbi:MAG TPA: GNAT family N-acetyltransferase [Gemmatimonadales bacterium]|nr:GNAT family N-acetyltransferase [Gemmatimonadales bacterium]
MRGRGDCRTVPAARDLRFQWAMTATMIDTGVCWNLHASCPPTWARQIERCGAGFFHSPPGLIAAGEQGEPFFAELTSGEDVLGIAAGVHRRCRVPPLPRHTFLPSPPALMPGTDVSLSGAIVALIDEARDAGWTELAINSLEAAGAVPGIEDGCTLARRLEYDVVLSGTPEEIERRLSSHHRRRLPDPGQWALHTLSGRDARALLLDVTSSARHRASEKRSVTYDVTLPPVEAFREDPAWGLTTYAAMLDGVPLAAVLVGWAGKRAYYVSGGSTPDGYACNASVWLHLQVALAFQSAGFTHYCLGGAPASAVNPSDPSHGLHRFKTGFGSTVRACAGARWVFGGEHETGHRLTRWIREHLAGSKELR